MAPKGPTDTSVKVTQWDKSTKSPANEPTAPNTPATQPTNPQMAQMQAMLQNQGIQGFPQGIPQGGAEAIGSINEMSPEKKVEFEKMLAIQQTSAAAAFESLRGLLEGQETGKNIPNQAGVAHLDPLPSDLLKRLT